MGDGSATSPLAPDADLSDLISIVSAVGDGLGPHLWPSRWAMEALARLLRTTSLSTPVVEPISNSLPGEERLLGTDEGGV